MKRSEHHCAKLLADADCVTPWNKGVPFNHPHRVLSVADYNLSKIECTEFCKLFGTVGDAKIRQASRSSKLEIPLFQA